MVVGPVRTYSRPGRAGPTGKGIVMLNILRNGSLLTVALLAMVGVALSGCSDDDKADTSSSSDHSSSDDQAGEPAPPDGEWAFSGPYTHANLTIFLIHGEDTIEGDEFLTLEQSLSDGTLVITETSSVNELTIENHSSRPVFLQAGEIIRGGKQDRMLRFDIIIRGNSGPKPLAVFCVEQGRWSARAGESVAGFSSSTNMAGNIDLKLANSRDGNQSAVWTNVAAGQRSLGGAIGGSVQSELSPTSMALTLETEDVELAVAAYCEALASSVEGKDNVIGYAVVINGQIESVDSYGSAALFNQLWSKLLRSSAAAALAESEQEFEDVVVAADDVQDFIENAKLGKQAVRDISPTMQMRIIENGASFYYESMDGEAGQVHSSLLRKE